MSYFCLTSYDLVFTFFTFLHLHFTFTSPFTSPLHLPYLHLYLYLYLHLHFSPFTSLYFTFFTSPLLHLSLPLLHFFLYRHSLHLCLTTLWLMTYLWLTGLLACLIRLTYDFTFSWLTTYSLTTYDLLTSYFMVLRLHDFRFTFSYVSLSLRMSRPSRNLITYFLEVCWHSRVSCSISWVPAVCVDVHVFACTF